jgi:hypothetical protein
MYSALVGLGLGLIKIISDFLFDGSNEAFVISVVLVLLVGYAIKKWKTLK